jgi:hypothetical protein
MPPYDALTRLSLLHHNRHTSYRRPPPAAARRPRLQQRRAHQGAEDLNWSLWPSFNDTRRPATSCLLLPRRHGRSGLLGLCPFGLWLILDIIPPQVFYSMVAAGRTLSYRQASCTVFSSRRALQTGTMTRADERDGLTPHSLHPPTLHPNISFSITQQPPFLAAPAAYHHWSQEGNNDNGMPLPPLPPPSHYDRPSSAPSRQPAS